MKKMTASILLIFSGLLASCVDQAYDEFQFTIYNETDKNVTVIGFNTQLDPNTNGRAEAIVLDPHMSYSVTRVNGIDDNIGMRYYSLSGGVDSVRVVFEDNKLLVYARKDVLDGSEKAGSILDGDKIGKYQYTHYITEEDYAMAMDCGDECY